MSAALPAPPPTPHPPPSFEVGVVVVGVGSVPGSVSGISPSKGKWVAQEPPLG